MHQMTLGRFWLIRSLQDGSSFSRNHCLLLNKILNFLLRICHIDNGNFGSIVELNIGNKLLNFLEFVIARVLLTLHKQIGILIILIHREHLR